MLNKKIDYFIAVVESGSFTAAARAFYLTQSAISQQISQLEQELDIILLDRSGYRPILTKAGTLYYQRCKEIVAIYSKTINDIKHISEEEERTLTIGVTGPIEGEHLPLLLEKLRESVPQIQFNVKKITFGNGVKLLKERTLDIAFGITNDFIGYDAIIIKELFTHQVCLICSISHPWSNLKTINGCDIGNEKIIAFSPKVGNKFYEDYLNAFRLDGIHPHIVKTVESLDELILSVRINEGIALISREVIVNQKGISIIDFENTHHHATYCMGYLKSSQNKYLKDFVKTTKDYFSIKDD